MKYSNAFVKNSSRILLGTAYFGDGISKEEAFALMDSFYERGGTHIDTARLYADGRAEEIVCAWLKSRRPSGVVVSTKGGYPTSDAPDRVRIDERELRHDLEKSLKALDTDCIDFYWLHRDDETIPVSQTVEMLNALVREGKIKAFGASNWTSARIAEAQAYAKAHSLIPFSASQIRFNPAFVITERAGLVGMDETEFLYYKKTSMPVVAYSSQAKGFFSKMAEVGESALSEKAKLRYLCRENIERLETIKLLSRKYDCSVASVICGALSSFKVPEVFPVVGCSRLSQLTDSMNGADITLTPDELEKMFKLPVK